MRRQEKLSPPVDEHEPQRLVVSRSVMRRAYRDRLRARVGQPLRFLFLKGDKALLRARVADRKHHFMPASLIDSQFATLESPESEPDVVTLAADADFEKSAPDVIRRLGLVPPASR